MMMMMRFNAHSNHMLYIFLLKSHLYGEIKISVDTTMMRDDDEIKKKFN